MLNIPVIAISVTNNMSIFCSSLTFLSLGQSWMSELISRCLIAITRLPTARTRLQDERDYQYCTSSGLELRVRFVSSSCGVRWFSPAVGHLAV